MSFCMWLQCLRDTIKDNDYAFYKSLCEDLRGLAAREKQSIDNAINQWGEQFSEQFFEDNPEIHDVLLHTETTNGGIVLKEWMATR